MIGVSSCLLGKNCTYNADNHLIKELKVLHDQGLVIDVCPEVLGGLLIPRNPAEIITWHPLKIETINHQDVTLEYVTGAKKALEIFQKSHVDVAVLKFRSPSCGVDGVYDGTFSHQLIDGQGVFAQLLKASGIQVFSENQMNEFLNYIRKDENYGSYFKNSTSI